MISNHSEGTFGRLRYLLGGDRPSQTAHLEMSSGRLTALKVRILACLEWYLTIGSSTSTKMLSQPPTYPAQEKLKFNSKLQ